MKVILLRDVAKIGRKHEVKDVPQGHATNFLIPQKLALPATPENLKRQEEETRHADARKKLEMDVFVDALRKIKTANITYVAEANEKGNLFKGVNADDISNHLKKEGIMVESVHIMLTHPLKELGVHTIELRSGKEHGEFQLTIVKK